MRTGRVKTADIRLGEVTLIKTDHSQNRPTSGRFDVEGQITQFRLIRIIRLGHLLTRMIDKPSPAQELQHSSPQLGRVRSVDRLARQDYDIPAWLDVRLEFL